MREKVREERREREKEREREREETIETMYYHADIWYDISACLC